MPEICRQVITRQELATLTGMSVSWLKKQDRFGTGCPHINFGRSIRYDMTAVAEWIKRRSGVAA